MTDLMKKARENHEIFEALYSAFKICNRVQEKMLLIDEIRSGTCRKFHNPLEEEIAELKHLLKKSSGKVLYLNHLCGGNLLEKIYPRTNRGSLDMVNDFVDGIGKEIKAMEAVV